MYKKLLVPVDGSVHSTRALQEAIKIAQMTEGTITLLNVQPHHLKLSPAQQAASEPTHSIVLNEAKRQVEAEGVVAETLLLQGNVVDQIVKTAKEANFDVIVIGARGLTRFEEAILGSVSHGVTEKAPCPVIVTR